EQENFMSLSQWRVLARFLSRVLAVLILAVPVVLIGQAIDRYEQEVVAKLSYQELRDYLQQGHSESFAGSYLIFGVLSLVYLGLVEGIAFVARLAMRGFRPAPASPLAGSGVIDPIAGDNSHGDETASRYAKNHGHV